MIDLHMHSKYSSDGSDEVSFMLKQAEELKLKCISITDHNTCEVYNDLKDENIRKIFTGKIIPGVELNTKVLGIPIEILCYNIDPVKMQEVIKNTYLSNDERNKEEVKKLYEKAVKAGVILPKDFVEKYDGSCYASKYFREVIIQDENNKKFINEASWNDNNVFYREYMSNPNTKFFINMDDLLPDFNILSKKTHEIGGMVFLPHIFEYRENSLKILDYILKNYEFDGIECYYRNFTKEQTDYLLDICKKNNLFVSGGSDYHGKQRPNIKMGIGEGNLCVPDDIVNNWVEKVL